MDSANRHSFRWPREPVKRCTWSNDMGGANLASVRTPPLENTTFVSELLKYCGFGLSSCFSFVMCVAVSCCCCGTPRQQPRDVLLCFAVAVFGLGFALAPADSLTVASVTNSVVPEAMIAAGARAGRDV